MIDAVSPSTPTPPKDDPAKVRGAARRFESLLISQLMKSFREEGGWLGTGEDQAASSAMEMAEEQFAQALAESGGLGLSKLIVSGLQR